MTTAPFDLDRARQEIEACAPEFENRERPWNQSGLTLVQVGRSLVAEVEKVRAERDESVALYRQWVSDKTADTNTVVEALRKADAELDALKAKLADPAVKAVVELMEKYDYQYRRAEAAHEAKDEANRRWLDATKAAEPPREEVATAVRSCSDKNGHHDPHDWRPDPSGGIEWCPGYPVPPAPALADDEPAS